MWGIRKKERRTPSEGASLLLEEKNRKNKKRRFFLGGGGGGYPAWKNECLFLLRDTIFESYCALFQQRSMNGRRSSSPYIFSDTEAIVCVCCHSPLFNVLLITPRVNCFSPPFREWSFFLFFFFNGVRPSWKLSR